MKPTHNMMQVRRARERTACRLDMLEAAERIFAAKGYDAATVEAIAHEAGCAAGTLYNFFAGKKELFLAVADRILDDMIARFDTEVAPLQNEPQRAIRVYIALRFDEISRHEAFMHVFVPHGRTHCAARSRALAQTPASLRPTLPQCRHSLPLRLHRGWGAAPRGDAVGLHRHHRGCTALLS